MGRRGARRSWPPCDQHSQCIWGCGAGHTCQTSAENYCERHASIPTYGGGPGSDDGMADYMIVPSSRLLVALGDLDPIAAAPLSDAVLTPYHAIRTPGASVLVLGVGSLGHWRRSCCAR